MKKILFTLMAALLAVMANGQTDTLTSQHPEYLPTIEIGTVAPEVCAPDTLGNKIALSDYRGKYVVLDFWASWCGDCRREIPFLKVLYNDVKDMLRKENMPWPQISSLKSTREDPTFKNYQLHWIPAFLIIDPEGKVAAKAITADGLRKVINDLVVKR